MRSFVSGVIWGGVVAALGLGVISQLAPLPQGAGAVVANSNAPVAGGEQAGVAEAAPEPVDVAAVDAGQAAVDDGAAADAPADDPATPATPDAPTPDAPVVDAAPEESAAAVPADSASADSASADGAPADSAAVLPDAQTDAPEAPAAPDAGDAAPAMASNVDDPAALDDPARPAAVAPDALPVTADLPPVPPLTPEEEALLQDAPGGGLSDPMPFDDEPTEPEMALEEDPVADPATVAEETPAEPIAEPEPLLDAPAKPAPGFAADVEGVTTGRLPSISQDTTENPVDAAAEVAAAAPAEDQPPLLRYAADFANEQKKPLFSVVLIDTGAAELDRAALAALPFPVTIALDPTAKDVAATAALYRAAGKEVVMLATGIPAGATPADLEVTFQAHEAALPEAVAVLDLEQGGFQDNRPLATQVVPVIKGQGRGLVTWDKGLNAGAQVAQREGVASGLVFRRLDGEGESTSTIRRYLDRAAFKAAQDGRVMVVGETNPDTIAALLEWSVEGRASSVALAPVSAVIAPE